MLQHALGLRKAVNGSYFALFHSIICRKLQCKRKAKFLPEELVITQKLESKMSQNKARYPTVLQTVTQNTPTSSILCKIFESYKAVFFL